MSTLRDKNLAKKSDTFSRKQDEFAKKIRKNISPEGPAGLPFYNSAVLCGANSHIPDKM